LCRRVHRTKRKMAWREVPSLSVCRNRRDPPARLSTCRLLVGGKKPLHGYRTREGQLRVAAV